MLLAYLAPPFELVPRLLTERKVEPDVRAASTDAFNSPAACELTVRCCLLGRILWIAPFRKLETNRRSSLLKAMLSTPGGTWATTACSPLAGSTRTISPVQVAA